MPTNKKTLPKLNNLIHFLNKEIHKLIQGKGNWRIRLMVFRNTGGLYTPKDSTIQFLVQAFPLDSDVFILNEIGLHIGIIKDKLLSLSPLSLIKKGNSAPYIFAGIEKEKNDWDDAILLNYKGEIAEATGSNIFFIKH